MPEACCVAENGFEPRSADNNGGVHGILSKSKVIYMYMYMYRNYLKIGCMFRTVKCISFQDDDIVKAIVMFDTVM